MAYGLINADVIGTSVANTSLGAGDASIMKNRIINGAMVIAQRGTSAVSTSDTYPVDRWYFQNSVNSKLSLQQNLNSITPPAGFVNYVGVTTTTAYSVGAGDYYQLQQRIEGYNVADLDFGKSSAKPITLSFWVRSSLTGTFGGVFGNGNFDRTYPFTYTISSANTWEQKSISIAGDTTGTWNTTNDNGLVIRFGLGVGSTYSGTAGSWQSAGYISATGATSVVGTNGATWYITGVQLEVGSSATGFEYVNYQTSLANCQRYYYLMANGNNLGLGIGTYSNSTTFFTYASFPVSMRTTPALVSTSGTNYYTTDSGDLFNSFSITRAHANGALIYNNTEMSGPSVSSIPVFTNNASALIAFNSEL